MCWINSTVLRIPQSPSNNLVYATPKRDEDRDESLGVDHSVPIRPS